MRAFGTVFAVLALATTLVSVPLGAKAFQETVIQFRSMDDPDVDPEPAVCARAPFSPNVLLGASLWSSRTRASDGTTVNEQARLVGTGTACALVTDLTFPVFDQAPFYAELTIGDLTLSGNGVCTTTSNDVPVPGLVLVGCTLTIENPPPGIVGGSMTSNSVFNPFGLPGFSTGSFWTVRLYAE